MSSNISDQRIEMPQRPPSLSKLSVVLLVSTSLAGCCFDSGSSNASAVTSATLNEPTTAPARGLLSSRLLADSTDTLEPLLLWSTTMESWVRTAPGFTDRLPAVGTEEACTGGGTKLALISSEDTEDNYHFVTEYEQCVIELGGVAVTYQGKSTLQGSYVEIDENLVRAVGSTESEDFSIVIAGYDALNAPGISRWNESLLGIISADSLVNFNNHSVRTVINSLSRTESESCELAVAADFTIESSEQGTLNVLIDTQDLGSMVDTNCEYFEYQAQQAYTEQDKLPTIDNLLAPQIAGESSQLKFEIPDAGSVLYSHSSGAWVKYEHRPAAVIVSGGTAPEDETSSNVLSKDEFIAEAYQTSDIELIR